MRICIGQEGECVVLDLWSVGERTSSLLLIGSKGPRYILSINIYLDKSPTFKGKALYFVVGYPMPDKGQFCYMKHDKHGMC